MASYRVDLRSDTVTTPSEAMRRAMAAAEVGDDWFGDDPTVNRLQERAAEVMGKEAALYVPTGTMANQIGLRLHFRGTGHLVVAEATAHVATTEVMSSAALSGMAFKTIRGDRRGRITAEQVQAALAPDPEDVEVVDLVAVEDTHGHAGGRVMAVEDLRAIAKVAHDHGVPVHLDGARIFNAAACLGLSVRELCAKVDTVMFCLSKGLGAPVGSMLVGPAALIAQARLYRKRLGGAMRQVGVLAAPGLIALEEMPKRLHEDHANARLLAEGLAKIPGIRIDPAEVETNILIVDVSGTGLAAEEVSRRLQARGVLAGAVSPTEIRMVTHLNVDRAGCLRAVEAMAEVAAAALEAKHLLGVTPA